MKMLIFAILFISLIEHFLLWKIGTLKRFVNMYIVADSSVVLLLVFQHNFGAFLFLFIQVICHILPRFDRVYDILIIKKFLVEHQKFIILHSIYIVLKKNCLNTHLELGPNGSFFRSAREFKDTVSYDKRCFILFRAFFY